MILGLLALLLGACTAGQNDEALPTPTPAPTKPLLATVEPPATNTPAPTVTPTAADPAPSGDEQGQGQGRAYIGDLSLSVMESFPVQVQAHIRGELSDACTQLAGVDVQRDGRTFQIQVRTTRDPQAICAQVLAPFETSVDLETRELAAGTYTVTAGDLSEQFTLAVDNSIQTMPDLGGASLLVEATSASPGEQVSLRGAGFPAAATVRIGVGPQNSEYALVDAIQAGADGRFTSQVQVPDYAEAGQSWVFVAVVANAKVLADPLAIVAAGQTPPGEPTVNQPVDGLVTRTNIYVTALGDNGQNGPAIGCEDSVVPVEVEIEPTEAPLTAAIQRLLTDDRQFYGVRGLYNVFHQSDLQLEGINLIDGQATIALSGDLRLGGACDNPRVIAQLEQTALQFSTVNSVTIYLNDRPLDAILSGNA